MLDAVTDLLMANGTDRRIVSSVEPSEYRPLLRCGSPGPTRVGNGSKITGFPQHIKRRMLDELRSVYVTAQPATMRNQRTHATQREPRHAAAESGQTAPWSNKNGVSKPSVNQAQKGTNV
jgi:hypothetical protein